MHNCPDCGAACYCHGDIDDIQFEETAIYCDHYKHTECHLELKDPGPDDEWTGYTAGGEIA